MLCQICKEKPAVIKISHVVNDKKVEMSLCKSCAEKKGLDNPMMTLPQIFGNVIAEIFGEDLLETEGEDSGEKCPGCGTSWEAFQQSGLLGCDICYQTFQDDLNIILRRIHGSNKHIGSRPKSQRHKVDASELARLNLELKAAIENEDFELAAELRDMVRDAQREMDRLGDDGILR
ncbi:MAG: hypothetical protein D6743_00535 [Calditrichaeota bacterium]|nr:MAG: hypothetical protein D6743_00535 [Calditrichota bacterium]